MTDREWPVNRARAWLLRKAAEMVSENGVKASFFADAALVDGGEEVRTDQSFRGVLSGHMAPEDIDRAVAEVYGEAQTDPVPRTPPIPTDVAKAWTQADRAWFVSTERVHTPDRLLERARGEYCAAAVIRLFSGYTDAMSSATTGAVAEVYGEARADEPKCMTAARALWFVAETSARSALTAPRRLMGWRNCRQRRPRSGPRRRSRGRW